MRYFYDTEFLEDGKTIDLISIGIVAEDGTEYYAVNHDADWARIHSHSWLERNVVPHLGNLEHYLRPHAGIAADVRHFLLQGGGDVELWADWSAYDHVALAQLFGTMLDLPKHVPMHTNDIRTLLTVTGYNGPLPVQHGRQHSALEDARHVKRLYDFISSHTAKE